MLTTSAWETRQSAATYFWSGLLKLPATSAGLGIDKARSSAMAPAKFIPNLGTLAEASADGNFG
jgi:hypothetical protein